MTMKAGISSEDPGRPRLEAGPYGAVNVLDLNREDLRSLFPGEPYRGDQVFSWVFAKGLADFSDMTTLPKSLRESMASSMRIAYPDVARHQVSRDGTEKFAYRLEDGCTVESVLIFEKGHWSVCVSSQAGCAMGCRFCKTAELGFTRNLSPGEIVSQVLLPIRTYPDRRFTNVVFMGMGEPLMNYGSVVKAANILMDPAGPHISKRRLTISTCGIVPALTRLPGDTEASIAVSLNAPDDETRSSIMPVNRRYPIDTLMAALRSLTLPNRRRITMEYVLIRGVNDSTAHARRLIKILHGIRAKVNLIPFNPWPGSDLEAPKPQDVLAFEEVLRDSPYTVMLRKEKGRDILAACGQLAGGAL